MYLDSGEGGEFWWLSPSPPSSSTPKDGTPKERNLPFPPQSLSPKRKRTTARRTSSSPTSPVSVSENASNNFNALNVHFSIKTKSLFHVQKDQVTVLHLNIFQSGCLSDKMHEMVTRITFYLPVKEERSAQNQIHNTLYHEEERAFL